MADWVRCTDTDGTAIYVNLDTAMSVSWKDGRNHSEVRFPGTAADAVCVQERPEAILSAREAAPDLLTP